jgi:hypothetical protein
MITSKRTILIVVAALLLGSIAALAVGVGRGNDATGMGTYGTGVEADGVLAEDTTAAEDTAVAEAVDPAKTQPTLDKFEVKDPFVPLTQPNTGTGGTGSTPTSAKVKVNGTSYTVGVGDKVPSGSPVFTISAITASAVTFQLPEGQEFDDGTTSVSVNVGDSVEVTNVDTDKSYTLEVVSVGYDDGGGGTGGHTVSLVSISQQGGVAMCTIEVDGVTYADKKEGDTFSTGWGDIKILSINVSAQSVTIMHGDQTLTLHVGSVLTK